MLSNWQNTPAATLLRFLADLMLVNLLLLCCSLGVVTIGAALTGMYAVLFKRQREDGSVSVLKTFFGAFANNFLWATALEGIVATLLLVAGVDFSYALTLPQPGKTLFIVIVDNFSAGLSPAGGIPQQPARYSQKQSGAGGVRPLPASAGGGILGCPLGIGNH